MKIRNRNIINFIVFLLAIAVITVALFFAGEFFLKPNGQGDSPSASDALNNMKRVYIDGEPYLPKKTVKNYLLIGVDEFSTGDGKIAQADFMMILSVDKADGSYRLISVDRDTVAEVSVCDTRGKEIGKREERIALSHSYGDPLKLTNAQKCKNTVEAISGLFYGIKIDSYVSMTMEAISVLVEALGGVELTVPYDMTDINEKFVGGEKVLLDGTLAGEFVGARKGLEGVSDTRRTERQTVFLEAFMVQIGKADVDLQTLISRYGDIKDSIVTNSGSGILIDMSKSLREYENLGIISIEGERVPCEFGDEFYPDEYLLKRFTIEIFFDKEK